MVYCFFIMTAFLILLSLIPYKLGIIAVLITAAFVIFFALKKKYRHTAAALLILLFCINAFAQNIGIYSQTEQIAEKTVEITATVTKCSKYENINVICVKTSDNGALPENTGLQLITYDNMLLNVGDIAKINCTVSATNENKYYYKSRGIALSGKINEYTKLSKTSKIYKISNAVRNYISETFNNNLKNSELLNTLFTGDKYLLDTQFTNSVRNAGVSHVLVVSGLHLSVICGSLYLIMRGMKLNKYVILGVSAFIAFVLVTMCGFTASVLRAAISYLIIVYADVIRRRVYGMNTLFSAAVIIMIFNPFVVADISFQLSFASSFGIIYFSKRSIMASHKIKNKILSALFLVCTTTISAFVAVLPITVYYFGVVSVVGVAVNVLVTYAVSGMLVFALLLLLTNLIWFMRIISKALCVIINLLSDYFISVVNYFGNLKFSTVTFRNTYVLACLLAVIFIIGFTCKKRLYLLKLIRGENYADR